MHTQFNTSSAGSGNTGSSSNLCNYLDKEQENNWFNAEQQDIKTEEVQQDIDQNGKGQLGKEDWKFVEVEYNPSQKEQQQIIYKATGRENITDWGQLSTGEKEKVKTEFVGYVREAQDIQAKNYNRENIQSGSDLKYYGKVETQRKYKGTDEAVKNGTVKQGTEKAGLHLHAHIVQSRKGADKKTKLSPTSKHRKSTSKNSIKQGFDRNEFYNKIENKFDQRYGYDRSVNESFEWKKANKFNRLEDKKAIENRSEQSHANKRTEYLQQNKENRAHVHLEAKQKIKQKEKEQQQNNNRGFSR
jgi:hypothetical protein